LIPASGFNTPPPGAVLNSAALLDDAGIKPAIQSIPIGNNHPLAAGWLIIAFDFETGPIF
jgi:hypothetical protein